MLVEFLVCLEESGAAMVSGERARKMTIRASWSDAGERSVGSGVISSSDAAEKPQPLTGSEASAGVSFRSSGDRSGAKNAGVPQDNTAGPLEKTTDESNTFEMWKATDLRTHASRVAGLSLRHASGKLKKTRSPLMAAFQAGSALPVCR